MTITNRAAWLALAAIVALAGCKHDGKGKGDAAKDAGGQDGAAGDGDGTDGNTKADGGGMDMTGDAGPVVGAKTGALQGFVYDTSAPPAALEGVTVSVAGHTAKTDASGAFHIASIPVGSGRLVTANDDTHTIGVRTVSIAGGKTAYTELFLKAVISARYDSAKGGIARDDQTGARASFPPNSLKRKDGSAPQGDAHVLVAAIDTKGPDAKSAPGPVHATNGTKKGILNVHAPMEMRVVDGDKSQLQIASGKNAEADFPVSQPDGPDEIDLWSLDEKSGSWVHEGKAQKKVNDKGQKVYHANVAHLSWWSVGELVENVTCARACIETPKGDPATGASLIVAGLDAPFRAFESTDADGCFALDLAQDSDFVLVAANADGVSAPKTFKSDKVAKRAEDDAKKCQDLGTIALVARPADSKCPSGYTDCNGTCVDTTSDSDYCGACDQFCAGNRDQSGGLGPYGSQCSGGTCQCPKGSLECNGQCIHVLDNYYYCGTTCPDPAQQGPKCDYNTEICDNGTCKKLTCDKGLSVCPGSYGAACVDTNTDILNCNGCGNVCASGGETPNVACVAGSCGCQGGFTQCTPDTASPNNYFCFDTQTDVNNCGGCYNNAGTFDENVLCTNTQTCVKGVCTELTCPGANDIACDHACFDKTTEEQHCGDCFTQCNAQGQSCVSGVCECPANTELCNGGEFGVCTDTKTDDQNCGACYPDGAQCLDTQKCTAGSCQDLTCANGQAACNHQCIDVQSDEQNCGGCGNYCGGTCTAGACTCPAGQDLCGSGSYQYCVSKGTCQITAGAPKRH